MFRTVSRILMNVNGITGDKGFKGDRGLTGPQGETGK